MRFRINYDDCSPIIVSYIIELLRLYNMYNNILYRHTLQTVGSRYRNRFLIHNRCLAPRTVMYNAARVGRK